MKVSIVIPVYNCERYISACLQSALSQTFNDYEIIVVNDGSTDGTRDEIRKFKEKVVYIEQENRGVSAARNTGILRSTAEYIAFLDADDLYMPENLEKMSEYLDEHPECGLVHCFFNRIDKDGRELPIKDNPVFSGNVFPRLFMKSHLYPTCVMCRRQLLIDAGLFSEYYSGIGEDGDLYMRMAQRGPFGVIPECLALYRVYEGGLSRNKNQTFPFKTEEQLMQYKDHLIRNYRTGWLIFRRRMSKVYRDQANVFLEQGQYGKAAKKALQILKLYPFRLDALKVLFTAVRQGSGFSQSPSK